MVYNLTAVEQEAMLRKLRQVFDETTTVKMLTGVLVPTSGQVTVKSLVPHRQ